jgi:putative inorganic carbon (HCO3(-)) transporter
MNKTNKFLWIYLTGIFLILVLPLLNIPPWFSPPDWGKTIVFRIIMSIMILVSMWQILSEKRTILKINRIFWNLIALLGIFFLATVFSIEKNFSLWGDPYRSGGFVNFAFLIIFCLLVANTIRKQDWSKIWIFSLIIGVFVSIIGIIQSFGLMPKIFFPTKEPWSTIGGSTFLAIYLLILSFIALLLTIKSIKNLDKKWFFYLPCFLLFIFVILLTGSRATYLGLIIGLLYFVFAYPKKLPKVRLALITITTLLVIIVAYSNTQLPLPNFIEKNKIVQQVKPRLSIKLFLNDPRFSVWQISAKAISARPVLGYGPENFSIAFDKYYDPSLPRMIASYDDEKIYYDRAHNFLLNIAVEAGIPALIIYILLLISLFKELQKRKEEKPLIYHGLQATLISYFIANFFGFDVFSTYLLFFLIVAYCLSISSEERIIDLKPKWILNRALIIPVFILLALFVWEYNIKPFNINAELNKATTLNEQGQCDRSLKLMEKLSKTESYLDEYINASYNNAINICIRIDPQNIVLIPKSIEILEKAIEQRSTFTRYWILLGTYYNMLLENYQTSYPEYIEEWKNKTEEAFQKAYELSPKRQEVFIGITNNYLITSRYEKAKDKAQECIDLNSDLAECWWLMTLANINLNELEEAKKNIEIAKEKGYLTESEGSIAQFRKIYAIMGNQEEVCNLTYKLTEINPNGDVYFLDSLACHINNKEYEEAKKIAKYIAINWPKHLESMNEYLIKSGLDPLPIN